MGCSCEILVDTLNETLASRLVTAAVSEAGRIESKYSRYRKGSVVDRINSCAGRSVRVDDETADLLDYAGECFRISDGLFDVTTGVLRKFWRFSGDSVSRPPDVISFRKFLGWDKVRWERPFIQLPLGFEIDLGGICKEYAADRILSQLQVKSTTAALVNLGGDIAAGGSRVWTVGIETPESPNSLRNTLRLRNGGVATSGTTKRFFTMEGRRLGHILNPRTLWPVADAPRSVTVAARTCTEAGFWSTLGVLQGCQAETFLKEQSLEFWCYR